MISAMKPPCGEKGVRKQFTKIQKEIDEFHTGDGKALENCKVTRRQLIIEVANRNEISPSVVEQLKLELERFTY